MEFKLSNKLNYTNNTVIIIAVFAISLTPFLLKILGVNFNFKTPPLENINLYNDGKINEDTLLPLLKNQILHGILEWTAVIIAMVSMILAFSYFKISKAVTTQIIGMTLFFSSITDALNALSSLRILEATIGNGELIAVTWAVSRIFNIFILVMGAVFAMVSLNKSQNKKKNNNYEFRTIILLCILFAVAAYIFNYLMSINLNLPQAIYPDFVISRPFDIVPIIISIFAIPIFLSLHKKLNNYLSFAILLMVIPSIILEIHMAFGSTELYDSDFYIAHILKIFSYAIPFIGMVLLHIKTYKSLEKSQNNLEKTLDKLNQTNEELEQFAYAASHDLQEPLRMVSSFTKLLKRDYNDKLDDMGREYIDYACNAAVRMQELIVDLLAYSRLGQEAVSYDLLNCNDIVEIVTKNLTEQINETNACIKVSKLPKIYGNKVNIMRVFQNLIGNALKYIKTDERQVIKISATENEYEYIFTIEDRGIGFDPNQADRIFKVFKRLHTQAKYPGTGIGLAMCKKIVNAHGGKIWAEGEINKGAIFRFTIPKLNNKLA